jgi:hypothetical protein
MKYVFPAKFCHFEKSKNKNKNKIPLRRNF